MGRNGWVICVLMFLGFSGTAPLCPTPRCICPLRAGIKKVVRAGWLVVLPQAAARSWTDWGWWFQPGSAKEPQEPGHHVQHFKRLHRIYTFTQEKDTQTTQNIKFPCCCWELQVCMGSCQCQVLIGCEWHNRNFWDRIGLTLDIVTRAGIRHHSPNWTCSIPLEWDWPWIRVSLLSKLSNRLFLVYLAVLIIISPVAMIWFHNIIMNPL